LGLFAATLRDIEPFVRKSAAHAIEHLLRNEIADGAFHHAPGGRSAQIDQLLRVEYGLQLGLDARVEVLEALAAMADHGRTKRAKGFFTDFNGPRDVQFHMCHKLLVKVFTCARTWQAN